ncbi:MAG TPA: ABC transporter permease [Chthonomonadaceae bacterium]|nr:ABC transporter permease [Chthonomonadaceae bacterium]
MRARMLESGGFWRALFSVLAGLLLAALLMKASGYDVGAALSALWSGATGIAPGPSRGPNQIPIGIGAWKAHLDKFVLAQSLARATPLIWAGLSVALALRGGLFNIGAQGQLIVGALAAAVVGMLGKGSEAGGDVTGGWPPWLHVPLTLLTGAAAGAVWGAIPGWLKARRGVHEVLSTILLNYIAADIASYLVTHGLKDPNSHSMAPQTGLMAASAWLTPAVPGSNLTVGLLLAVTAAALVAFLLQRTALGYEIRAVGLGQAAAEATGIPAVRTLVVTMGLAGALAGLAGAVEVMGVHHRYVPGVAATYGFDGIAVALLGGLTGSGTVASGLFFGLLASGASGMQRSTDVPDAITVIVQAVVILVIGVRYLRKRALPPLVAAVLDTDERREEDADRI